MTESRNDGMTESRSHGVFLVRYRRTYVLNNTDIKESLYERYELVLTKNPLL